MSKFEELIAATKLNDIIRKKDEEIAETKKCKTVVWVLAIIGAVVAIAGIAYAVYRYFTPDYLEDFEEDFEGNEFEDDFFAEEDGFVEE
ncbi:MAG: DUF4366 domain-containing protein [Lachnospiraceae bacterium]|nr:DUF4366 domain-containing protein [Lachnospira sp.]MBQ8730342.1 DUF4366 domain-containing protein [Lachnospiraceae bacterium]MBR6697451.1 DUF4366 domain-containing protein [Lachnospiraceae bacterium]